MKRVTYIGPYRQGVEIEPDPKNRPDHWVTVRPGESIDVAGSVADGLAAQVDAWRLAGELPQRPPRKAKREQLVEFVDALNLDGDGRPETGRLTVAELWSLIDQATLSAPTTTDPDEGTD